LQYNQSSPSGSAILGYNGYFYATRVYNAYLSDFADFIKLNDSLTYGSCYKITPNGAVKSKKRCEKGVIGIASDVYGHAVGQIKNEVQVPISVAGWVLAHVDKIYESGTLLTCNKQGQLTKMRWYEKFLYPERMVGIYLYKEIKKFWGPEGYQVEVKNRSWVKVK